MELISTKALKEKFDHLWNLVGNTPLLKINYQFKGIPGCLFVKCENYN